MTGPIGKIQVFIVGMENGYRGHKLERQLAVQGLGWVRAHGVDVSELPLSAEVYVDREAARVMLRREIRDGEIGCALAHRGVYESLLKSNQDYAVVLEDDALLVGAIERNLLTEVLDSDRPRLLMLRSNPLTAIVHQDCAFIGLNDTRLFRTAFPPTSTVGYALNRAAARLLVDDARPITNVADWPIRAWAGIEFYIITPSPVAIDATAVSVIGSRSIRRSGIKVASDRTLRLARAISHITWFQYREMYGTYKTYLVHEFIRQPACAWSSRWGSPIDDSNPDSPTGIPYFVASLIRLAGKAKRIVMGRPGRA